MAPVSALMTAWRATADSARAEAKDDDDGDFEPDEEKSGDDEEMNSGGDESSKASQAQNTASQSQSPSARSSPRRGTANAQSLAKKKSTKKTSRKNAAANPEEGSSKKDQDADFVVAKGAVRVQYSKRNQKKRFKDKFTKPRKKRLLKPLSPDAQAGLDKANAMGIVTQLAPFGHSRFETFAQFDAEFARYCGTNYVMYRCRHSQSAVDFNSKTLLATDSLPRHLTYKIRSFRCVHGCTQESRGSGVRYAAATRYTGCEARISAAAMRDSQGTWFVHVYNELVHHNHTCDEVVFDSYVRSSLIDDRDLFNEMRSMVLCDGNSKKICDIISTRLGRVFTRRMLENWRAYRLGGASAEVNTKVLLGRFSSFAESRVLVVDDQDDHVCGIVMQSGIQREFFQRYGDTLILDWTHKTNNLGFYMGCLMVTSATGKGVPVLDFLCVSQSQDMMRTVLKYFVDHNEGAVAKVESVVIDKDYKEWRVLEEIFPDSTVVLCQFHVLQHFQRVLKKSKYKIAGAIRDEALETLRGMVYARSTRDLEALKQSLALLLKPKKYGLFLEYMNKCWYNCELMWSNSGRGDIFTATNTTSNRLETYWGHVKALLAKKKRMDRCLETLFTHETSVLRREKAEFAQYLTSTPAHARAHPFVAPFFRELSKYAYGVVKAQWDAYVTNRATFTSTPRGHKNLYVVRASTRIRPVDFTVDVRKHTCSCHAFRGSRLPCRHLFFVVRDVLAADFYPVDSLVVRWRMSESVNLVPALRQAADESATLRAHVAPPSVRDRTTAKVAHVRLHRNEVHNSVIMTDTEKRGLVLSIVDDVKDYMMRQGTVRFRDLAIDLTEVLAGLLQEWKGELQVPLQSESPESPAEVEPVEGLTDHDDQSTSEAESWVDYSFDPDYYNDSDDAAEVVEENSWVTDETLGLAPQTTSLFDSQESSSYRLQDHNEQVDSDQLQRTIVSLTSLLESNNEHLGVDTLRDGTQAAAVVGDCLRQAVWSAAFPASFVAHLTSDICLPLNEPPTPHRTSLRTAGRGESLEELVSSLDEDCHEEEDPLQLISPVDDYLNDTAQPHTSAAEMVVDDAGPELASSVSQSLSVQEASSVRVVNTRGAAKRAASASKVELVEDAAPEQVEINHGIVSRLVLPDAGRQGVTKENKQATTSKTGRVAPLNQDSGCPVPLSDFVEMLQNGTHLQDSVRLEAEYPRLMNDSSLKNRPATVKKVSRLHGKFDFNFVVPPWLLKIVDSAVLLEKDADEVKSQAVDLATTPARAKTIKYVATVATCRPFSEDTIRDQTKFNEIKVLLTEYASDISWLNASTRWEIPTRIQPVSFLQKEATLWEGIPNSVGNKKMRAIAATSLETATLKTVLIVKRPVVDLTESKGGDKELRMEPAAQVQVENVLGRLAGLAELNDSVINFSLHILAAAHTDVTIVDSLQKRKFTLPEANVKSQRVVVFPVNLGDKHWCVACVSLTWDIGDGAVSSFLYDPLGSRTFQRMLEKTWHEWCQPFMAQWIHRDMQKHLGPASIQLVSTPKQKDGMSCGLHCIIQANCFISDDFAAQNVESYSTYEVKLMRLRLLTLILDQQRRNLDDDAALRASATAAKFTEYYRAIEDARSVRKRKTAAKSPTTKRPRTKTNKSNCTDAKE